MLQKVSHIMYGGPYDLLIINHTTKRFVKAEKMTLDDQEDAAWLASMTDDLILETRLHSDSVGRAVRVLEDNGYVEAGSLATVVQ